MCQKHLQMLYVVHSPLIYKYGTDWSKYLSDFIGKSQAIIWGMFLNFVLPSYESFWLVTWYVVLCTLLQRWSRPLLPWEMKGLISPRRPESDRWPTLWVKHSLTSVFTHGWLATGEWWVSTVITFVGHRLATKVNCQLQHNNIIIMGIKISRC